MPLARFRGRVSMWPKWLEALIVIVGAFGLAFISTARYLFDIRSHAAITEHHLRFLLVYEPVVFLLLGTGLALGAYTTSAALWILASAVKLQPANLHGASSVVGGAFALPTVIAASIVNPLFEELFVCGYVITAAKETGHLTVGVNASIAIRLAYHLYQGGAGVVGIVPFGLISAVWFSKTGRLWPVVVAHALTDFAGLAGNISQ